MTMTNLQSEDAALKAALGMVITSTQGSVTAGLRTSYAAFSDYLYSDISPADVLAEPAQRLASRAGGLWHWGEKRRRAKCICAFLTRRCLWWPLA